MIYKQMSLTEEDFIEILREKNHRDNVLHKLAQRLNHILTASPDLLTVDVLVAGLKDAYFTAEVLRTHGPQYKTDPYETRSDSPKGDDNA